MYLFFVIELAASVAVMHAQSVLVCFPYLWQVMERFHSTTIMYLCFSGIVDDKSLIPFDTSFICLRKPWCFRQRVCHLRVISIISWVLV